MQIIIWAYFELNFGGNMLQIVEAFLINMFFIIFMIFLNLLFLNQKSISSTTKKIITLLGGVLQIILVMIFPIQFQDFSFDLRQVPITVGFLYSGPYVGVGLFLIMIFIRILIGGTGIFGTIYINVLFLITLFFL